MTVVTIVIVGWIAVSIIVAALLSYLILRAKRNQQRDLADQSIWEPEPLAPQHRIPLTGQGDGDARIYRTDDDVAPDDSP